MQNGEFIQPHIQTLTEEQRQRVHDYSLRVLENVGVRVDSEPARELLVRAIKERGSQPHAQDTSDRRVFIPRELVEWALKAAPSSVQVYDRRGNPVFRLGYAPDGQEQTRFGIGVTTLYYQDPQTDQVTPFSRKHMERIARLANVLSSFDLIATPGIVQDVTPQLSDLYATLEMTANTAKPLSILVSEEDRFTDVLNLLEHLHGDPSGRASGRSLAARPFVVPYFNPISPLVINKGTADKMLVTIERGLPFMYSNYGMAGATTPITPAGAFVVLNAELLAGLVLSQLIKEGAPIILGSLPAYLDMKGMGNFYEPRSYVINLACAEMMAFYRLPHCGTSGSGMGWGADLIAGGNQWANHLTSCLGKVGLVPFVGDTLNSKAIAPAVIVLADDIIRQARRLARGFPLDDASVALEEIEQIGPGGNFLTSGLTLQHFRSAYYRSAIWPNLTMEEWEARGRPRAEDMLRAHTQQLLHDAQPPEDYADVMERGEAFIQELQA